jgi:FKBP-type peptidyl-prolyl cis-trans isomerase SlyD
MKAQIVSFHCVLKNRVGIVISSTFNRDVITFVDKPGKVLRGLAETLQHLRKGDKKSLFLSAEEAYGLYNPQLVVEVPRKKLAHLNALQIGHQIQSYAEDGDATVFRVIQITPDSVTMDGNHPLAGQDLLFEIETVETRAATSDEIAESCSPLSTPYFH